MGIVRKFQDLDDFLSENREKLAKSLIRASRAESTDLYTAGRGITTKIPPFLMDRRPVFIQHEELEDHWLDLTVLEAEKTRSSTWTRDGIWISCAGMGLGLSCGLWLYGLTESCGKLIAVVCVPMRFQSRQRSPIQRIPPNQASGQHKNKWSRKHGQRPGQVRLQGDAGQQRPYCQGTRVRRCDPGQHVEVSCAHPRPGRRVATR